MCKEEGGEIISLSGPCKDKGSQTTSCQDHKQMWTVIGIKQFAAYAACRWGQKGNLLCGLCTGGIREQSTLMTYGTCRWRKKDDLLWGHTVYQWGKKENPWWLTDYRWRQTDNYFAGFAENRWDQTDNLVCWLKVHRCRLADNYSDDLQDSCEGRQMTYSVR